MVRFRVVNSTTSRPPDCCHTRPTFVVLPVGAVNGTGIVMTEPLRPAVVSGTPFMNLRMSKLARWRSSTR
jgi:hypothetical protein